MSHRRLIVTLALCCHLLLGCGTAPAENFCATTSRVGDDTAARFFHRASLLNSGPILVTGGMRLSLVPLSLVSLNNMSFYNPTTRTFSASFAPLGGGPAVSPVLLTARSSHTQTTLLDGRVLITGGRINASGTNPGTATATCELFDPQTGTVSTAPPMSAARAGHTATRLADGRVLIAGGTTWQLFDPVGNAWSADLPMQRGRNDHAAVLLPNGGGPGQERVLLVAGSGNGSNTLELINPASMSSTLAIPTLTIGVDDTAAARLDDDSVLIVGGQDLSNGNTVSLSYLYHPVADTLDAAPPPPNRAEGISDHEMVTSGQFALIFGGEQEISGQDLELSYVAAFDRQAGDWVYSALTVSPHDDFPAIPLPSGRIVLIGGGVPFLGNELPSAVAEEFEFVAAMPGDVNADGLIDGRDVQDFIGVLFNPGGAPLMRRCPADANGDGSVDALDVGPFVGLLTNP